MSSNSKDEEEIIPLLFNEDDKDYIKTCDDEVNEIVPRLEKLRIIDNEGINLPFGFSIDSVPSSIHSFKSTSIFNSAETVCSILVRDMSDEVLVNEDAKEAIDNKESLSDTKKCTQVFATNMQNEIQSREITQDDKEIQMHPLNAQEGQIMDQLDETKEESVCDERPLDLSSRRSSDHDNEDGSSSAASGNKAELGLLMFSSEQKEHVDPETGEIKQNLLLTLPGTSDETSPKKSLEKFADEIANGLLSVLDSSMVTYSADESFDDQSDSSNGIVLDSPADASKIGATISPSTLNKRSRKIANIDPPVPGIHEIRKRRFGIFQPPSDNTDTSKKSSSDEDSNNSSPVGKQSQTNYRRKCKRAVKSLSKSIIRKSSGVRMKENRPISSKRKKKFSENMTETAGKYRKRSISEHNLETGENTHVITRSRSLSPGLKNIHDTSSKNKRSKNLSSQPRKRTNSYSHCESRAKFRKSSTSTDVEEI